jgi:hypothetical protein
MCSFRYQKVLCFDNMVTWLEICVLPEAVANTWVSDARNQSSPDQGVSIPGHEDVFWLT